MLVKNLEPIGEQIERFPGDRSEADWLAALQFLCARLGETLGTPVQFGCYWIGDSPGYASANGCVRIRGNGPVPGIESDHWEAALSWSGNRGERGYADASVFPFLRDLHVTSRGRLGDCAAAVAGPLVYVFENGEFVAGGWDNELDEWNEVSVPGTVYWQRLTGIPTAAPFSVGAPLTVDFKLHPSPDGSAEPTKSIVRNREQSPRVSLMYVNRNREHTNLVPWTARPPLTNSRGVLSLADCQFPTADTIRLRLDQFSIRGGWTPGRYHLAIRIQNHVDHGGRSFTGDISEPCKLTIVE